MLATTIIVYLLLRPVVWIPGSRKAKMAHKTEINIMISPESWIFFRDKTFYVLTVTFLTFQKPGS
jgi:hypothetical protein